MRVPCLLVVIFLVLLGSFSLGAQVVTTPIVTAPYQLIGDIGPEDLPHFTVEVEGQTYKVQTPHTFARSVGSVRQVTTIFSPVPIHCGKYPLAYDPGLGYSCKKEGVFVWFAAGGNQYGKWRTEIFGNLSPRAEGAANFDLSMRGMDGKSKSVMGGNPSIQTVMSGSATGHAPGRNTTLVIVGDAECGATSTGVSCYQKDGTVTGSVKIILKGTSEEVLDGFTTQLTFIYTTNEGRVEWQVAVPVTWLADATNRWTVPVVETPMEVKGVSLPPDNSSFAVLNLCDRPQTVRVSAHGWSGEELWAHNLPKELEAGVILPQLPDILWSGGVYADMVSSLFGDDIKTGVIAQTRVTEELPFRGLLRFVGSEDNCKIAVLGLRVKDAITSTIAHPEK